VIGFPSFIAFALTAETGPINITTIPALWFRIPYPWRIRGVRASVYTPSVSGSITIDILSVPSGTSIPTSVSSGTSIFTTPLTIDENRPSSVGSLVPAVLTTAASTTGLADDTGLAVFITSAGTGSAGLKIFIYYHVF
jgi:hypothetical protein